MCNCAVCVQSTMHVCCLILGRNLFVLAANMFHCDGNMLHYSSDINNKLPSPNKSRANYSERKVTVQYALCNVHCASSRNSSHFSSFPIVISRPEYYWNYIHIHRLVMLCDYLVSSSSSYGTMEPNTNHTLIGFFSLQEDAKLQLFLFIFRPKNLTKCTFAVGPWYVHLFIRTNSPFTFCTHLYILLH